MGKRGVPLNPKSTAGRIRAVFDELGWNTSAKIVREQLVKLYKIPPSISDNYIYSVRTKFDPHKYRRRIPGQRLLPHIREKIVDVFDELGLDVTPTQVKQRLIELDSTLVDVSLISIKNLKQHLKNEKKPTKKLDPNNVRTKLMVEVETVCIAINLLKSVDYNVVGAISVIKTLAKLAQLIR